jgi:hypothetical protein
MNPIPSPSLREGNYIVYGKKVAITHFLPFLKKGVSKVLSLGKDLG